MIDMTSYDSPIGKLFLASKEDQLIGLWLEHQKCGVLDGKEEKRQVDELNIFINTKKWLNQYFNGEKPRIDELVLNPRGSEFRKSVWNLLLKIPYGGVTTYCEIAKQIAKEKGISKMSAQAVGGAVAHNPIAIIIPCHRVVGVKGNLTGYAGGLDKKVALLQHEKVKMESFFFPKGK